MYNNFTGPDPDAIVNSLKRPAPLPLCITIYSIYCFYIQYFIKR